MASQIEIRRPSLRGDLRRQKDRWLLDRYNAAEQIIDFLGGVEPSRVVADLGCGDGTMALGLAHRTNPARLVGYDLKPVSSSALTKAVRRAGLRHDLPDALEFQISDANVIPSPDGYFDLVYSWSAFEHVENPEALLRDVRRVLKPGGVFMLQLWPFFTSQHGSHLMDWFPEGFAQLKYDFAVIDQKLREDPRFNIGWAETMLREFQSLNRLGLDDLQRCLLSAGLKVAKLELLSNPIDIPKEIMLQPLSSLGITGMKLLAKPG